MGHLDGHVAVVTGAARGAGVNTPMLDNAALRGWAERTPQLEAMATNLLPIPMVEPGDISDAVLGLASESTRYVTGVALPVDAGFTIR